MTQNTILGVDTGGTFTDFVLYKDNKIQVHKILSTPHSPEKAILQGIKDLGLDTALDELSIIHGSTVATNAVLEGKGVKTAYITNTGLKDVLTIGRQARKELYNLTPIPESPPVPEDLCLEIDVRLDYLGNRLVKLTPEKLSKLAQQLKSLIPQAIAINLLYSYIDASDEIEIESYLKEYFKQLKIDVLICRSSQVLPEYKEYERGISTWINAWVGPKVSRYLHNLVENTQPAKLTIMQSSGGTMSAKFAAKNAVRMLLSGPAGGLAAAQSLLALKSISDAKQFNKIQLLTFDMGGTSTDVALVEQQLKLTNQGKIGDYPISVPMVDMHTIGAGGGSIAYIDSGGLLQVGPKSAGSKPGPACYDFGGKQATVTDANLILGRLTSQNFLGGEMQLNYDQAFDAIEKLAISLELSVKETALGIIELANEHMGKALRVMSVQKGIDPSELNLLSFGGAGALHVCALADKLEMDKAIIPNYAGVFSAFGMLVAPSSRNLSQTFQQTITDIPNASEREHLLKDIAEHVATLKVHAITELLEEGFSEEQTQTHLSFDLRYVGQSYSLNVSVEEAHLKHSNINSRSFLERCCKQFHDKHQNRYGHKHQLAIELVTLRIDVTAHKTVIEMPLHSPINRNSTPEQLGELPLYRRSTLTTKQEIKGPALIIEEVSTTYLAKYWSCRIDDYGHLHLYR